MCLDPVSLAVVGTVVAGASAYQATSTQKAVAGYQAKVADNNAQVARWQAADAEARGNTAAANVRRKYAALAGTQRASLAARGVDISDGSANAMLQDTAFFGAVDESTTRANAAREAWGYQVQAGNFASSAAASQAQANAMNPLFSAGTTMLGTATSVASKWYGAPTTGGGGWDAAGFTGTNDRSLLSTGDNMTWFLRNGSSGD